MAMNLIEMLSNRPRTVTGHLSQIFGSVAGCMAGTKVNALLNMGEAGSIATLFAAAATGIAVGRLAHNSWTQWRQSRGISPLMP